MSVHRGLRNTFAVREGATPAGYPIIPGRPIRRCDASRGNRPRVWNWPQRVVIGSKRTHPRDAWPTADEWQSWLYGKEFLRDFRQWDGSGCPRPKAKPPSANLACHRSHCNELHEFRGSGTCPLVIEQGHFAERIFFNSASIACSNSGGLNPAGPGAPFQPIRPSRPSKYIRSG